MGLWTHNLSNMILLPYHQPTNFMLTGLSLTIMLVMYTMYQSISSELTKTAYLKMIDYWLLFCLLMPFITLIVEFYWLLLQDVRKIKVNNTSEHPSNLKNKKIIQLLIPAVTITFIVCFFISAIIVNRKFA